MILLGFCSSQLTRIGLCDTQAYDFLSTVRKARSDGPNACPCVSRRSDDSHENEKVVLFGGQRVSHSLDWNISETLRRPPLALLSGTVTPSSLDRTPLLPWTQRASPQRKWQSPDGQVLRNGILGMWPKSQLCGKSHIPISGVVSMGRCNTSSQSTRRSLKPQSLSRTPI